MIKIQYIVLMTYILGLIFGCFLGFVVNKSFSIAAVYMRKWRSLAQKYEDALLDIRTIAVSALCSEDNTNCLNSLENIHQKAAQTLWEQKND